MWMTVYTPEELVKKFQIDEAKYTCEAEEYFRQRKPHTVYLFAGTDSDSKVETLHPKCKFLEEHKVDK